MSDLLESVEMRNWKITYIGNREQHAFSTGRLYRVERFNQDTNDWEIVHKVQSVDIHIDARSVTEITIKFAD